MDLNHEGKLEVESKKTLEEKRIENENYFKELEAELDKV